MTKRNEYVNGKVKARIVKAVSNSRFKFILFLDQAFAPNSHVCHVGVIYRFARAPSRAS